jgi:hypothetical protein
MLAGTPTEELVEAILEAKNKKHFTLVKMINFVFILKVLHELKNQEQNTLLNPIKCTTILTLPFRTTVYSIQSTSSYNIQLFYI